MPKINIGGSEYQISKVDKVEGDDILDSSEEYAGMCRWLKKEIHIKKGLEKQLSAHVLRHEIFHALLSETGFDDLSANENLVNMLATQHANIEKVFKKLGVNNDK